MTSPTTIKRQGITWKREDSGGSEAWTFFLPKELHLTHFCVKNYGGTPNDANPFSGWRVVSGGPFTNVGGWTSRDAAMAAAGPWLVAYYTKQARDKLTEAKATQAALDAFLAGFTKGGAA